MAHGSRPAPPAATPDAARASTRAMHAADLRGLDPTGARTRLRLAASTAPVAVAAFAASLAAYGLLLTGSPWAAPALGLTGAVFAATLVPLAVGLAELSWPRLPRATRLVAAFGVATMGLGVALHLVGLAGVLQGASSAAFVGIGAWACAASLTARRAGALAPSTVWLGVAVGVGFALPSLAFMVGGPLEGIGRAAAALSLAFPLWVVGLARAFRAAEARPTGPGGVDVNA